MNVRLHPMLRCTFDAEEDVLRVVLQEPTQHDNVTFEKPSLEVVVYALKVRSIADMYESVGVSKFLFALYSLGGYPKRTSESSLMRS